MTDKSRIAAAQALVDFGLCGALDERSLPELTAMVQEGVMAFNLHTGSGNPLVPCPSDGTLVRGFEALARLRGRRRGL